jgi:hypothetical protein
MQTYEEANAVLTGRCQEQRKVGNNTWLIRRGDNIAVRLHRTDVVTYMPDGTIRLNTGGWQSVTTKARMCEYTPLSVSQRDWEWYVSARNPDHVNERYPDITMTSEENPWWLPNIEYVDGMTWHPVTGFKTLERTR